jgi:hypothetical protein
VKTLDDPRSIPSKKRPFLFSLSSHTKAIKAIMAPLSIVCRHPKADS